MPQNLAAYTAPGANYPPFISINKMEDGTVQVVVRSVPKEDGSCGEIASIVLEPTDPIAERFLFPVLSITHRMVENLLGGDLDKRTKAEVYQTLPYDLRLKIVKEVEALL